MVQDGQESDEVLLSRVQRGDHRAFSTLVRRHTNMFFATAYRMSGNAQDAEDTVQEAFLKLWNRPEIWNASKGAKFTTWFYRVVVNLAIDRQRKDKKYIASDDFSYVPDTTPRADEAMVEKEKEQALEKAIASLPERQKTALNLCFYEGLSNAEAAEIMGLGIKAVESLLMRAKNGLKDELTRAGMLGPKHQGHERRHSHA